MRKEAIAIKINNEKIGAISEFLYSGSKITRDGRCNADIRSRIGQAMKVFANLPQF